MRRWVLGLLGATFLLGCGAPKPELHLFCWNDYLSQEVLDGFAREHSCKVTLSLYESSQDMLAKLLAGGGTYDVVFPSDDFMPALVEKGLLQKLDMQKLGNRSNLDARYLTPPL